MVIRYFRNKERLFAAAVTFDLRLPDLTQTPKNKLGIALVHHFLERWEGQAAGDEHLFWVTRSRSIGGCDDAIAQFPQAKFSIPMEWAPHRLPRPACAGHRPGERHGWDSRRYSHAPMPP